MVSPLYNFYKYFSTLSISRLYFEDMYRITVFANCLQLNFPYFDVYDGFIGFNADGLGINA